MIARTALGLLLCLATAAFAGACGPAPWVNIPAQAGDVAMNNPNYTTALNVSAHAIRATVRRNPIDGPYIVLQPPGTERAGYERVLRRLGDENARSAWDGHEPGVPVVEVGVIQIRGHLATVEVLIPEDYTALEGPRQLITVNLVRPLFSDWRTDSVRVRYREEPLDVERFREFEPPRDPKPQPDPDPDPEPIEWEPQDQAPDQPAPVQPEPQPQPQPRADQPVEPAEPQQPEAEPFEDDERFELEPLDPIELD